MLILYIIAAVLVWILSSFGWAMAMMGYQFEKWYHWSSLSMYGIAFGQPVLYAYIGYKLFF